MRSLIVGFSKKQGQPREYGGLWLLAFGGFAYMSMSEAKDGRSTQAMVTDEQSVCAERARSKSRADRKEKGEVRSTPPQRVPVQDSVA